MLSPFLTGPRYRFGKDTPWGGSELLAYGRSLPDTRTGESLEVSALPGLACTVASGPYEGMPLDELTALLGPRLTGREGPFPLLGKLIDAREPLSVQVHPGDAYAQRHGLLSGKTEAWAVLDAAPGAVVFCGLQEGCPPFRELCKSPGLLADALCRVPVRPGDIILVPAGMVHALDAGVLVYEIQQPSDVTYRVWDWGRTGPDGQPRPLHLDSACAVVDDALRPTVLRAEDGARSLRCPWFCLERLSVDGHAPLPDGKLLLLTALSPCEVRWEDGSLPVPAGRTAVVPADCRSVSLEGPAEVLCASLPD